MAIVPLYRAARAAHAAPRAGRRSVHAPARPQRRDVPALARTAIRPRRRRPASSSTTGSSTATGLYGENGADYPDNYPPLRRLRRGVGGGAAAHHRRPGAAARARLARRARPGLPPHLVPRQPVVRPDPGRAVGAQRRLPGTLPRRGHARDRLAMGPVHAGQARVVRQDQLSQGRPDAHRHGDDGEPDPRRGTAHAGRRLRPAGRLRMAGQPLHRRAQRHRPERLESGDRSRRSPPSSRATISTASAPASSTCSAGSACPRIRSFRSIASIGRMATQKGLDIVVHNHALFHFAAQYVFLGSGDRRLEEAVHALHAAMPNRVGVVTKFSDALEHVMIAGADLYLMPSQYEPCGLTQMRAQRYGTIPVARRVGGLADTIDDGLTGFLFDAFDERALVGGIWRAMTEHRSGEGVARDAARSDGARLRLGPRRRALQRDLFPRDRARRTAYRVTLRFVLTLHSHLPWVLHHGRWPHGSDWICEAALDSYLPLIAMLDDARTGTGAAADHPRHHADPRRAVRASVIPRRARRLLRPAARDHRRGAGIAAPDRRRAPAAAGRVLEESRARRCRRTWERIGKDLIAAFRRHALAGRIEMISSAATHGFLPLLVARREHPVPAARRTRRACAPLRRPAARLLGARSAPTARAGRGSRCRAHRASRFAPASRITCATPASSGSSSTRTSSRPAQTYDLYTGRTRRRPDTSAKRSPYRALPRRQRRAWPPDLRAGARSDDHRAGLEPPRRLSGRRRATSSSTRSAIPAGSSSGASPMPAPISAPRSRTTRAWRARRPAATRRISRSCSTRSP